MRISWRSHMLIRVFLIALFLVSSSEIMAGVETVKLEKGITLKFDNTNWVYQYIKVMSSITPHILENKIEKDLKVIVQKETHAMDSKTTKSLIEEKCTSANKFYQESNQGSAKIIEIKNKKVCFILLTKKENNTYQILYPVNFSNASYDLLSFAWNARDEKDLKTVSALVGENL